MTESQARQIGGKYGLIAAGIGVLIVYLLGMGFRVITTTNAGLGKILLWFTAFNHPLHFFGGLLIMLIAGYLLGQWAGQSILIKGWNPVLTGMFTGFAVLVITGTFVGCMGFLREGIHEIGRNSKPFVNYILEPVAWMAQFGFLPSVLLGIWFGKRVQKQGKTSSMG